MSNFVNKIKKIWEVILMQQRTIIVNNEQKATKITIQIMLLSSLVFPTLIFLGLIRFYDYDMSKLYVYCAIGLLGTISPFILKKLGVKRGG